MKISFQNEACKAASHVLARIGDKWTIFVVCLLSDGPMRFNGIQRAASNISQKMLTLTLRGLERDGLVRRTVYPTIPQRVDYELTELGSALIGILIPLKQWAFDNRERVEKARASFDSHTSAKSKSYGEKIGAKRRMPAIFRSDR